MPVIPPDFTCDACGFNSSRWSDSDIQRTLAHADDLVGHVAAGMDGDLLSGVTLPNRIDASGDSLQAVHMLMHHLLEIAQLRRETELFEPMEGSVAGLRASDGGVPKQEIPRAVVGIGGVEGDSQKHRVHHGRPWQALCLYSVEVIEALRVEGHSIAQGSTGENLTIEGIDWSRMRGGLTLEIGDVRCRVSAPADPCYQLESFFEDADVSRIAHSKHPGWSRWYASVIDGGVIRPGDAIVVTA